MFLKKPLWVSGGSLGTDVPADGGVDAAVFIKVLGVAVIKVVCALFGLVVWASLLVCLVVCNLVVGGIVVLDFLAFLRFLGLLGFLDLLGRFLESSAPLSRLFRLPRALLAVSFVLLPRDGSGLVGSCSDSSFIIVGKTWETFPAANPCDLRDLPHDPMMHLWIWVTFNKLALHMGTAHVLVLVWKPIPHGTEQVDQGLQPSSENEREQYN